MSADYHYTLTWERMPECALSAHTLRLCVLGAVARHEDADHYLDTEGCTPGWFGPYETGYWDDAEDWLRATSTDIPGVWFTVLVRTEDGEHCAFHALNGNVEEATAEIKIAPPSWATQEASGA